MDALPPLRAPQVEPVLAGGGEMGARMREIHWSQTPLGPVETWPQSLKTCVRIVLTSRQPMFVWWGPELINLYNDAYKSIVGGKHPRALGQPAAQVWHEIWDEVGPRAARTMSGNEGTYDEALLLIMERNGYAEETYYTFSYSPVPDDGGGTGGLICANTDDTLRVIGERRVQVLRDLAARTPDVLTPEDACRHAALSLERAQRDVPFALVYLSDASGTTFSLAGASGVTPGHEAAPVCVSALSTWPYPITQILEGRGCVVSSLDPTLGPLPKGAWDRPPSHAVGIRVGSSAEASRSGLLILGLSPFRLFDESYRGFVELVASQIAASIGVAQAYEAERRRAETLAELDLAKTAFFSNVSHEFRTPLTLILGPVEDALRSSTLSLTGENLNAVHRNALRLLKLVNSLLDFSRIEAGRVRAAFRPTDLSALTADLSSTFRSAIERAGLALRTQFEPLDEPVYVDHDMWENLVLNLLSNALKFTFDGGIEVRLQRDGKEVELSVADSGVGIAEEALPNVFKRFHRVQGTRSRTNEGSGIGLALVHELARLHGGTVAVKSQVGRGTTFTVRVPLGSAHLPLDQLAEASATSSALQVATPFVQEALRWLSDGTNLLARGNATPPLLTETEAPASRGREASSARILVVDDNADMREYVTRLLSPRFELESVGDGAAALAAIRRKRPALVLSDVMMPNLDGFGLLRALRGNPETASLPVILLSARAGEEASVEGLWAGADDYLVKPFSARELLARVENHLQIASLRAAAEAESAKMHAVFMQAPIPVALLSGDDLRYDVANAPYCEIVGRDVVGKTLRECYPEIADHPIFTTLEGVYRSGEAVHDPELCVPLIRNGLKRNAYFNYVAQPLRDLDGRIAGIVIVASDVTEQVTSRERVDELRAAAERASHAKDAFLSTLSHELRTPLSAIVGWAALLLAGNVAPSQRQTALEAIERNARAQARLIEDMLDLSRIEQGKVVLSVGPVEVMRVVEAALDAVRPAAEAKGIRLQPVLDSLATIVGDPDRLQQVVWNLLSNAIKFTPKEGRVQVSVRGEDSQVYITVADNGQGIDEAFLPHVFDRFRQGDAAFSRRAGGLGLGLAIVRSLVELHGGTVSAQSDGVGRGATFVVRLPTAPLRADRATPTGDSRSNGQPVRFECLPELRGLRALVVDDEPDTRALLSFLLDQCETKVTSVGTPSEALSLLETQQFDVLISDVGMPEMDGHEFLRRVRKLPAHANGHIPAVALTAYARPEDRTEALRAGFNMHLAKPIEPAELVVVVATVTQHQRGG